LGFLQVPYTLTTSSTTVRFFLCFIKLSVHQKRLFSTECVSTGIIRISSTITEKAVDWKNWQCNVLSAKVGARTCSVIGNRDGGKAEGYGGAGATCDWPTMVTSGDKSPARFHWYNCYLTVDFAI